MFKEAQVPVDSKNVADYNGLFANKNNAGLSDRVAALRNAAGYEAVFDPDAALHELGKLAVGEACDALNPQLQPGYVAQEGGPDDYLIKLVADKPDHTFEDARAAQANSEASVTNHGNGTYTLRWEAVRELTVDGLGRVITDHAK
jgi:hypothetical protein